MTKFDVQQLDEWLSAYLDGELTEKEAQLVESTLREDEVARRRLTDLRRTVSLVTGLPRHAAPPALGEELMARLERAELLDDVEQPMRVPRRKRWRISMWGSLAAALGICVLGGWWMFMSAQPRGSRMAQFKPSPDSVTGASGIESAGVRSKPSEDDGLAVAAKEKKAPAELMKDGDPSRTEELHKEASARIAGEASASRLIPSDVGSPAPAVDLETKLAKGFDAAKVRGHRFRDESVRLRVQVREGERTERVAEAVRTRLVAAGVPDIEYDGTSAGRDSPGSPTRFFQRGRQGENFEEKDSRQLVARVTAKDLEDVLGGLASAGVREADVQMVAGTLVFDGSESVRETLQSVASRKQRSGELASLSRETVVRSLDQSENTKLGAPSVPSEKKDDRRRATEQWAALWESLAETLTAPTKTESGRDGAAAPTDRDKNAVGSEGTPPRKVPSESSVAASEPGLVARRVSAARAAREPSVANQPATVETDAAPLSSIGPETDFAVPAGLETESERLITLVIEVSFEPIPSPKPNEKPSAPSAREQPTKPPSVGPSSR